MSAFIDEHRDRFGVEPICEVLDLSASAYYQRASGERSERAVEDERLIARIRQVHEQNFECYGYPRVWHQLGREGEQVGRDRVARLMRQEGIRGAKRRGKPWRTTIPDPQAQRRPDLVNRDLRGSGQRSLVVHLLIPHFHGIGRNTRLSAFQAAASAGGDWGCVSSGVVVIGCACAQNSWRMSSRRSAASMSA